MPRGVGRKKEDIYELLETIRPYLEKGVSLYRACCYCEVPYTSMIDYIEKDELVRKKVASWKNKRQVLAEEIIYASLNDMNIDTAKWLLPKVDKDQYSEKSLQDVKSSIVELHTNAEFKQDES